MSDESTAAPVVTPITDHGVAARAAAIALMEADTGAPETEEAPPAEAPDTETAPVEAKVEDSEQPEEKVEAAPEKKEEEKEEPPNALKKSFEVLAREKAALRKEREEAKAERAELQKFKLFEAAIKNQDPMGLLAAAGLKYSTLVKQLTDKDMAPEAEEAPQSKEDIYLARIEALENERKQEKYERDVEKLDSSIVKAANAAKDKFALLQDEEDMAVNVRNYLLKHIQETGSPPGESFEESIEIALEAFEAQLEKQASRWKKKLGLTAAKEAPSVPAVKSAVETGPSAKPTSKTLSTSHATNPRIKAHSTPTDPTDYRKQALDLLNKME